MIKEYFEKLLWGIFGAVVFFGVIFIETFIMGAIWTPIVDASFAGVVGFILGIFTPWLRKDPSKSD